GAGRRHRKCRAAGRADAHGTAPEPNQSTRSRVGGNTFPVRARNTVQHAATSTGFPHKAAIVPQSLAARSGLRARLLLRRIVSGIDVVDLERAVEAQVDHDGFASGISVVM